MYFALSEPCEKTYCAWGATCIVSEDGKALCHCPTDCPLTSDPVCGSDDVTYENYCHLRQVSCQKRKNTRVKHQGVCGECPLLFLTRASGKVNGAGNRRELRIIAVITTFVTDFLSRRMRFALPDILFVRKMRIYLAPSEIIRAALPRISWRIIRFRYCLPRGRRPTTRDVVDVHDNRERIPEDRELFQI